MAYSKVGFLEEVSAVRGQLLNCRLYRISVSPFSLTFKVSNRNRDLIKSRFPHDGVKFLIAFRIDSKYQ